MAEVRKKERGGRQKKRWACFVFFNERELFFSSEYENMKNKEGKMKENEREKEREEGKKRQNIVVFKLSTKVDSILRCVNVVNLRKRKRERERGRE